MKISLHEQTISIDDLRRSLGQIKKMLPFSSFILTDRGKPIGQLSATREMKRELMKKTAGAFKNTELENDTVWHEVKKKASRKHDITV